MLAFCKTEQHIIKAMENGAQIVFHCFMAGGWGEEYPAVSRVTLEHKGQEILLSTQYRKDEFHYVPCDEGGTRWLRHGEYSRLPNCGDLADSIIKRGDIRKIYVGGLSESTQRWQERYEHVSQPVPRWITEQWDDPADFRPLETVSA